ncbi:MAG TPA: NusA N-terminal domain-containing protein, partial [Trueperaceae bacterium]|nr:NusA N-terminal domain-containing protein [Trueperaceae bacterium]
MNKEFVDALNMLAAERNLSKEQLLHDLEDALAQAFERNIMPGKQIEVDLDSDTGEMEIVVIRKVVETVEDPDTQISLEEALELDDEVEVGMEMEFPV